MVDRCSRQKKGNLYQILPLSSICKQKEVTVTDKLIPLVLPTALMSKSRDLANFMVTDDRRTKPITLPLAHVRGGNDEGYLSYLNLS